MTKQEQLEKALDTFTYKGVSGKYKLMWRKQTRTAIAKAILGSGIFKVKLPKKKNGDWERDINGNKVGRSNPMFVQMYNQALKDVEEMNK